MPRAGWRRKRLHGAAALRSPRHLHVTSTARLNGKTPRRLAKPRAERPIAQGEHHAISSLDHRPPNTSAIAQPEAFSGLRTSTGRHHMSAQRFVKDAATSGRFAVAACPLRHLGDRETPGITRRRAAFSKRFPASLATRWRFAASPTCIRRSSRWRKIAPTRSNRHPPWTSPLASPPANCEAPNAGSCDFSTSSPMQLRHLPRGLEPTALLRRREYRLLLQSACREMLSQKSPPAPASSRLRCKRTARQ